MRERKAAVRIIKAHHMVMFKAYDLLVEKGAEEAEKYLRGRGLMADNEMLYSSEERITDRSPWGAGFSATPLRLGVIKMSVR